MLVHNIKSLWISAVIIILDQASKIYIRSTVELDQTISIIGKFVQIHFIMNPGMAFGIQIGGRPFFIAFSAVACLIIFIILLRLHSSQKWTRLTLLLILGGALGNLIDRVYIGQVVDFLEVGPWPIFNVADVAVILGMIVLIVIVLFENLDRKELNEDHFEIEV